MKFSPGDYSPHSCRTGTSAYQFPFFFFLVCCKRRGWKPISYLVIRPARRWRRTRRAAREGITKPVVRDYHPILFKEAILLASALLRNPEAREKHFQRCSASATMSILYDYPTLETENDKTLKEIHAFNDRESEASAPGAHLVEIFPWMVHIPDRSVLIPCLQSLSHGTILCNGCQHCQVET